MGSLVPLVRAVLLLGLPVVAPAAPPVAATVETTLTSAGAHIRMLAFDGDGRSYFASVQSPGPDDHFTLVFDRPVALASVTATTGRPDGRDRLDVGTLAVSADGRSFEPLASFAGGVARASPGGRKVRAVRVRPAGELKHPLAIREIAIASEPPVAVFKYPVEFVVDASEAPEMKGWIDRAARVCERQYPMICAELKSDGFGPPQRVGITLKKDDDGVAATSGSHITGSARYFKAHPDDVGAMVHETVHVVQNYSGPDNPGWLVEGIADYIRFFKYEPGKIGRIDPDRARYDGGYRESAAFLAFVSDRYDKELVRKLNARLRAGKYRDEVFKELTGKTVQELGAEWKASLRR